MTVHSHPQGALNELRSAYQNRVPLSVDKPVLGVVGRDVPVELVRAAGYHALRLRGNPDWDTTDADFYLSKGVDHPTRAILSGLLAGKFGQLDGLIISSDCDASLRLFYVLREMARVGENTFLPKVYLVDLMHLPRAATDKYNGVRMAEFVSVLEDWSTSPISPAALRDEIEKANATREIQRRVLDLRVGHEPRLSGSDALALVSSETLFSREDYVHLLEKIEVEASTYPVQSGKALFLTGSNHDTSHFYDLLAEAGYHVVGEDHDWGESLVELDIEGIDLASVTRRYQYNVPMSQTSSIPVRSDYTAERVAVRHASVLLSYSRLGDEAPLWDFPEQAKKSDALNVALHRQTYGRSALRDIATALHETSGLERSA